MNIGFYIKFLSRYALEFLNLIKYCCSCFKHYLTRRWKVLENHDNFSPISSLTICEKNSPSSEQHTPPGQKRSTHPSFPSRTGNTVWWTWKVYNIRKGKVHGTQLKIAQAVATCQTSNTVTVVHHGWTIMLNHCSSLFQQLCSVLMKQQRLFTLCWNRELCIENERRQI